MEKTRESFGERVKRLRKMAKWTQDDLAKKAGLSIQMVKDIEKDRTPGGAKSYKGLAFAFGISIEELIESEVVQQPRIEIKVLPASHSIRKYLKIPDAVVDMAQDFDTNDEVWDIIKGVLETRAKSLPKNKQKQDRA